jgi:membrane protease YdiL (CAAX protease family)
MPTLRLLGLVIVLLGLTAFLSPPVATALAEMGWDFKFSRVYNRVFEILLVLALVFGRRWLQLGGGEAIGFRRAAWWPDLRRGFAIGAAGLAVALAFCWLANGLVPQLRYDETAKIVRKTLQGLGAAAAVGTLEEVIFRGVLLRRFSLDLGPRAGLLLTTAIYSAVHLLHPKGAMAEGPFPGVTRTLEILAPLGDPANLPTFVGLFAFGLILAWARLRTGSIWTSVGIHAAWVALFRVGRVYFRIKNRPAWVVGAGWPPLIGGATGAVAVAVTAGLLALALRRRAAPPPA